MGWKGEGLPLSLGGSAYGSRWGVYLWVWGKVCLLVWRAVCLWIWEDLLLGLGDMPLGLGLYTPRNTPPRNILPQTYTHKTDTPQTHPL